MAADPAKMCNYCGWLGWTVEQYGRVTHKQGCPHRTDPWHQGDAFPAAVSPAEPPRLGARVGYVCNPGVVALGVVAAIYEDGRVRIRWDDGWTDEEGAVYGFEDLLRVKS